MHIRNLTPADFPGLLQLPYTPLIRERDTIYLILAQDHGRFCFVAETKSEANNQANEDEQPLGVLLALGAADVSSVFMLKLWIRADYRGQGIGSRLLDGLEAAANRAGVRRIWLLATDSALDFYQERGYSLSLNTLAPEAARYVREVKGTPVLVKEWPGEAPTKSGQRGQIDPA